MPDSATAYTQELAFPKTSPLEIEPSISDAAGSGQSNGHSTNSEARGPNLSVTTVAGQGKSEAMLPRPRLLRPKGIAFQRLEERDGVVLAVHQEAGTFAARLVDPRGKEPDQEVEVDLEQVSPADWALLSPGALFFWAIGYLTRDTGRQLLLRIDFRRRPQRRDVSSRAIKAGAAYAEEMGWS